MLKFVVLWGQLIVFMGSFIVVTNFLVYDFVDFFNDNLVKIVGVVLVWLVFVILCLGLDVCKSCCYICVLCWDFVD